jgi:hypothetical protein
MWEVMNVGVTMHNMIIDSERIAPVTDGQPYDLYCPVAQVDHKVATEFAAFSGCIQNSVTNRFIANRIMIR